MRVQRMRKRGHYDRATIDAILDAGILCHVGFVHERQPVVIQTLYWREGDYVYLHGSIASRMLGEALGTPVCVCVTHLDGLVLARSAFHHSANYRSAILFGCPTEVTDPREREARMRVRELKATRLLSFRIDETSAKIRSGPPADDAADRAWPRWGGVLPLAVQAVAQPDQYVKDAGLRAPRIRPSE